MMMNPIIYTFLVFGFACVALRKRDSKGLFLGIMLFCWVVIALSMDSYDISNYRGAYDYGLLRRKEPLFDLLQWTFASLGIPFDVFKVIYGTVIWLLLYRVFQQFTLDKALAAAIFVLGPMMGFGTQMRSSMAGAIVINAIPLLLKKDAKIWKYCLMVAVASLFHLMAVFYFIFVIPKFWKIGAKKFRNYMCLLALTLIPFFLLFAQPLSKLFAVMQTWTNISAVNSVLARFAKYFSGEMGPNIKGFLFAACGHFVVFLLTDRMCVAMQSLRKKRFNIGNENLLLSSYTVGYLRKLNSILVLIIPCYILSMQFDRFNSYYLPVCYCLIVQGAREVRLSGLSQKIELPTVKNGRINRLVQWINRNDLLQTGNFEILVLVACLVFCFFVNNRFSTTSEFVRIVNGIAMFGGPQ